MIPIPLFFRALPYRLRNRSRAPGYLAAAAGFLLFGIVLPSCQSASREAQPATSVQDLAEHDPGGIPVATFFGNPEQTAFSISPDGRYLSWLGPWENRMNLFVRDLEADEAPRRLTAEKESDLSRYHWANKHQIVYLNDGGGAQVTRLFVVELDAEVPAAEDPAAGSAADETSEARDTPDQRAQVAPAPIDITPFASGQLEILDPLPGMPDAMIVASNNRNPSLFEPYRLNLQTGAVELLVANTNLREPMTGWVADHEGVVRVAFSIVDGVKTKVLYRPDANTPFQAVLTTDWTTYMHPLFFDFDNRTVYAASNVGRDKTAIVQYDLESNRELAVIYENEDVDVFDVGYSRNRACLTWVGFADEKWEMVWLDSAASGLMQRIREDLGEDVEIKVNAMDQAESRFVVRTFSDRSLGSWYLYDAGMDRLIKLAEVNPAIDPSQMAAMQPITYQARDGLALPAYLTLPSGRLAEGLPLVVMPHGGPRARTYWGFQPDVQLLANRGYAVLQVNYRGSLGYGRAFARAGFGAWGDGMQNDLQDGVSYLVDAGIVDPARVAIAGYSFGGYCALAGLAFQPETYACGVSRSGLTDLNHYVDSIPDRWAPYRDMLYNMVGDPKRDSARLVQFSPSQHSQAIQAPLLLVHGVHDKRIPVSQARQLVRQLEEQGKPVYYLEIQDAGHRFLREEQRLQFYQTMVGFLGRFMPPDLAPSAKPSGFASKPLAKLGGNKR